MRRCLGIAVAALALLTAGCGGSSSVGSDVELSGDADSGALRDTTTTAAEDGGEQGNGEPSNGPAPNQASPTTTTTAPRATTTTQARPQNIVLIQDDEQGAYFEPRIFQVPRGQDVTWRNVGTKTRKVLSDRFASPDIPPGGEWAWTANVDPQTITYRDGTRPYAQAQLQVF